MAIPDAPSVDRLREREAYALDTARQARVVLFDCAVGRLMAVGLSAIGVQETALIASDRAGGGDESFLLNGNLTTDVAAERFVDSALLSRFPDVAMEVHRPPSGLDELEDLVRGSGDLPAMLVAPLSRRPAEMAWEMALRTRDDGVHVRVVAAGAGGCGIATPTEDYEEQLRRLATVGEPPADGRPCSDTALVAAGMLLHEARLMTGARLHQDDLAVQEQFPADPTCIMSLPPPGVDPNGASYLVVGAGGIGTMLVLFGLAPREQGRNRLFLVDGDVIEPHNLLLHRRVGDAQVDALRDEAQEMGRFHEVQSIRVMVTQQTTIQRFRTCFAVTDTAHSRILVHDAIRRAVNDVETPTGLICAGSSLTGAEAFYADQEAACPRCRYPGIESEPAGGACSRRPATFASNMIAAGLALCLSRRQTLTSFRGSRDGLCRFTASTARADRFAAILPQRCGH